MTSASPTIHIGDIIHLRNSQSDDYLDTRGRVTDKSAFWNVSGTEICFVSTNGHKNRDNGSGGWRILSATGKEDGTPVKIGDQIHLQNMYPGAGYLDCCGWIEHLPPFDKYKNEVTCGVFTAGVPNRDNGTGIWIIRSANESKENGASFQDGDAIFLENGYQHPDPTKHKDTGRLIAWGTVTENAHFPEYEGQKAFVFTSDKVNSTDTAAQWTATLANAGEKNQVLYFGPELLKGRTNNMKAVIDMTRILFVNALTAVSGLSEEAFEQALPTAVSPTPMADLLTTAKTNRAATPDLVDHDFQVKQLFNLFTLSHSLNTFNETHLQKLMLDSLIKHRDAKTMPPLYLIRTCFRRIATNHEIIQRAIMQRQWRRANTSEEFTQSEQAVELLVTDKLAIKAITPFQKLLPHKPDDLAVITYFSDTTHIHNLPYTDRFIVVAISYDRISVMREAVDEEKLTGRDFAAFELLAIPHEVGHYVYNHGRVNNNGQTFAQIAQQFRGNPYYRWCEEIFADLYGCIIAGPLSVFGMQAFLTSGDRSRAWHDDDVHPNPMIRSYILAEMLRELGQQNQDHYDFSKVADTLDEAWTKVLEKWGYSRVDDGKPRPTRIYQPDHIDSHFEKIVNVERVITAVRPIITEFARLLLDSQPSFEHIPWSQTNSSDTADYAQEMAALASREIAQEAIPLNATLDIDTRPALKNNMALPELDKTLRTYVDDWDESGPHGWGGH